jgi:hypothetical protein
MASREQLLSAIKDATKNKIIDESFERAVLKAYADKLKDDKFILSVIEQEAERRAAETVANRITDLLKTAFSNMDWE